MAANHEYCYWQDKIKMLTGILDAGDISTRAYGLILKLCTDYWVSWDIRTAKLMNSKKTFFRATHCVTVDYKYQDNEKTKIENLKKN